ncbi:ComC/BlpC family peptide pheromone/bacteriocin [Streptococcus chenjunshii]|uniref:ComC/BlpC family peptide pheromone/bacteriocin n=1 Tax=Streptococcus chenjunshii TaxID=2173853 RepID=A0A372KM42_9STRE|nr:leucocin A/sakacin P family class II bacteriocin [Streptococcus chenjunshii]AXQ79135.1 ComC/BlpC family peptide pheromone/bacteriocin [Streptococcus chenjunshii]RFU50968.1 ComC/BlpC family peptide pheromone/bacteriocin [Streptococcus chenjunshii]RFU53360.1 ComC/BlpC family peptide pheromone/bacteriocin [Streptococcus chenjunshii]
MTAKTLEQFETMTDRQLSAVEGGKTTYYGNGLYCNENKCWVNWSQTATTIANNSAMNLLTGGNAGWHSGGIA